MRPLLVALVCLAACAHKPRTVHIQMDPVTFTARPTGEVELVDAGTLFEQAGAAFRDQRFSDAATLFDRLAADYPDSRYVAPSLYNAGLSLEGQGDLPAAAERYRRLIARAPDTTDALDACFRLGAVYVKLENHAAAASLYAEIVARKDATLSDRVEALARRGEAQFRMKDLVAAERTLREQRRLVTDHATEERLDTDFFVGMGAYYLGQIAHEQYRLLPVRLPEKQLEQDLEAKARMLLVAQGRYLDTIRVKDAEWATAAGYQIATLYREFYDDLVGAPVPPQLTGEAREVYLEELRKQVKNLLHKAVAIHERNVLMAERIGAQNDWVRKSNEQMEQLRRLLAPGPTPPSAPAPAPPPAPPLPRPRDEVRPHAG